jgi:uncharacterized membrane protein HdeD (DUF308 family)
MEEQNKKITGLKIAKGALSALAGVCTLVTNPITSGLAIAAGLGSVIADIALDNEIDNSKLAVVK